MDNVVAITKKTTGSPIFHQVAKLVLATVAGFAASKLTEKAFDSVVSGHDDNTPES